MDARNFDTLEEFMNMFFGETPHTTRQEKHNVGFNNTTLDTVTRRSNLMRTNAYVDKEGFTNIEIEMPGFNKEEIEITLEEGVLTIAATKAEKEENDKKFIINERRTTCRRSFNVPLSRTVDDFKVTYENGILHIVFEKEKPEDKKNTHINIL